MKNGKPDSVLSVSSDIPPAIGPARKFTIDVVWILITNGAGIVLGFLVQPLLARWLGASGLGIYSLSQSVFELGVLVANFGIAQAILKYAAEDKENQLRINQFAFSGFTSSVALGVIIAIVIYTVREPIARFFNMADLARFLPILAFATPFASLVAAEKGLINGFRRMNNYAILGIGHRVFNAIFVLSLVGLGFDVRGAIIGLVLTEFLSSLLGLFLTRKHLRFTLQGYVKNTGKLLSFGGQVCAAEATSIVLNRTDTIMIGYFLAAADVGLYSVALTIIGIFSIIPGAIQMITFPSASEYWAQGNYRTMERMIDKSMRYSACVLVPLGLVVGFFARDIMNLLFGAEYIAAAVPLCILLIARVIRASTLVPIGNVIPAIGRPDISFKLEIISTLMNIGLNWLFIPRYGIAGAAIATTISLLTSTTLFFIYLLKLAPVRVNFRWHFLVFSLALLSGAIFWGFSNFMNRYLTGGIILAIYIGIFIAFLLTKEDRNEIMSLARSFIHWR